MNRPILTQIARGALLAAAVATLGCSANVVVEGPPDGGDDDAPVAQAAQSECGCRMPGPVADESLPFCTRVCNGVYTDWYDDCGIVQLQIDCSAEIQDGICRYNPKNGSAFCGPPD